MSLQKFELHGLYQHGQPFDGIWQWSGSAPSVHFEDILRAALPSGVGLMPCLDACTLHSISEQEPAGWSIRTDTTEIAVSINGQPLALGVMHQLQHGDMIEVGLYSFRVQSTAPALLAESPLPDFQLTDLDPMLRTQRRENFCDLIAPEPRTAAPDVQMQPHHTADQSQTTDVLHMLHAQYLRKLHDPTYNGDEVHWQALVQQSESTVSADPLQELVTTAMREGAGSGLSDLLGQTNSIHDVLASLDDAVTIDFMVPDKFDSVIHLFAPTQPQLTESTNPLQAMAETSLAQLVQSSLPGLTLREHHSLSLDSAMPFLAGDSTTAPSS